MPVAEQVDYNLLGTWNLKARIPPGSRHLWILLEDFLVNIQGWDSEPEGRLRG